MDNTQTKRLKVFYSDMLIISLRMGGGGWGRCNSDLSPKCVSWEFPVMQIVLFFLDTWAIFLCDHLHHPNHFCFLDNWDNTSNHMESSLKHKLCSVWKFPFVMFFLPFIVPGFLVITALPTCIIMEKPELFLSKGGVVLWGFHYIMSIPNANLLPLFHKSQFLSSLFIQAI